MLITYDATRDFPAASNRSGPWAFGYSPLGGSDYRLVPFDKSAPDGPAGSSGMVWSKDGYNTAGTPCIWKNGAAFPRAGVPSGQLSLHPGPKPNGDLAVLRFTAPSKGSYKVKGQFFAGDSGAMSGSIVLNERLANPQQVFGTTTDLSTFDLPPLQLNAGDRVDFVVGNNGNFNSGNTPIVVTIEGDVAMVPEAVYDAVSDLQVGSNAAGPWRYGYSIATGSQFSFIAFDKNTADQVSLGWSAAGYNVSGTPSVWLNRTSTTRYGVPPGALSLHPGPRPGGDVTVMRFIVPKSAMYTVQGAFGAGDSGRMEGTVVLDGNFGAPLARFDECRDDSKFQFGPLALRAGQTLDLVLGNNGNFNSGNTPVWATIKTAAGAWDAAALNAFVAATGSMPEVVMQTIKLQDMDPQLVDAAGVQYRVTSQKMRQVTDIVNIAYLNDIAAMGVWPGQVLQSQGLLKDQINAIGPFARVPGRVHIVTDFATNTPAPQFQDVAAPDASAVNEARRGILRAVNPSDSGVSLKVDYSRASTLREVGAKLGLAVSGSAFSVDANATLDQTFKQSVVLCVVRQVFYSVTFTPRTAGAAGFWDSNGATADDLGRYMRAGNPPLYVDSVQYGRLIVISAKGAFSSTEITAALKAKYTSTVDAAVDVSARFKEVIESLDLQIYTLGVPGRSGFQSVTNPMEELDAVFKGGAAFNVNNPGVPVSFTCCHIANGTSAHVALVADFVQPLTAQGIDVVGKTFEVFDGPGGGLRDTAIIVNPGDQVHIGASGMVGSNIVFSGPHGPSGWNPPPLGFRGYNDDTQNLNALGLIHRFGTELWKSTNSSWDGSPSQKGGRLVLNINDNNPYNGDPQHKWTVTVDVKRANAGAVGIYI